jgi:CHAD domain-containing protein
LQANRGEGHALSQAAQEYERVLARVPRWPLGDHGWRSLDDGLAAAVREGRRRMAKAVKHGEPEGFHEWRKQAKYLRHQLELLTPAWPEVISAMASTAAGIGDLLGVDHDLAVLGDRVRGEPGLSAATRQALLDRIDERRQTAQKEALAQGRRLYAEKPAALTRRLGRLWKVAA